ncbi:hypothetical protein [Nocardia wallacei]|uniref:hypothetical protein n=1 Tax=Nocardia wallacei TaxID=480035 RepID=UPI002454C28D|nr:hypothetical protein [Nocardia wallacei]
MVSRRNLFRYTGVAAAAAAATVVFPELASAETLQRQQGYRMGSRKRQGYGTYGYGYGNDVAYGRIYGDGDVAYGRIYDDGNSVGGSIHGHH